MDTPDGSAKWGLPGLISVEQAGSQRVLCLVGEIDQAVIQAFEEAYGTEPGAVDTIDAGAVSFMTSAGIELMLRWRRESVAQGRPAVLRQSSGIVDRLLELTGLTPVFDR